MAKVLGLVFTLPTIKRNPKRGLKMRARNKPDIWTVQMMNWRNRAPLRTTIAVAALICWAAQPFAGSPPPESGFAQVDGVKALVGHSNGTPVIRQFYRKFPEKTRALVIVDGGLRPFGDKAMMEKLVATLKAPNYEENAGRMIDGMVRPIQDARSG